jgi:vancomycin resistance protein YoaR
MKWTLPQLRVRFRPGDYWAFMGSIMKSRVLAGMLDALSRELEAHEQWARWETEKTLSWYLSPEQLAIVQQALNDSERSSATIRGYFRFLRP